MVVHGLWEQECRTCTAAEMSALRTTRCTDPNHHGPHFHVLRSKLRQIGQQEQVWTIADVATLATFMDGLRERIVEAQHQYEISTHSERTS
jgi:hypothetical protein